MNTMRARACQGKQMKAKKRVLEERASWPKAYLNIWGLRQTLVIVVKLQLQ